MLLFLYFQDLATLFIGHSSGKYDVLFRYDWGGLLQLPSFDKFGVDLFYSGTPCDEQFDIYRTKGHNQQPR